MSSVRCRECKKLFLESRVIVRGKAKYCPHCGTVANYVVRAARGVSARDKQSVEPQRDATHEASQNVVLPDASAADTTARVCPFCAEEIKAAAIRCKHCHADLGSAVTCVPQAESPNDGALNSRSTTPEVPVTDASLPGGTAVLILICCGVLFLLYKVNEGYIDPVASAVLRSAEASGPTLAQYEQLQTGISYEQATRLLGSSGSELSRVGSGSLETVMYSWSGQGSRGANMTAMFQNDRLVAKAQAGLR
jgi:phage FluMu protein Com